MTPIRNEVDEIIMSVPDGMTAHEIHKLVYAKFAGTDTGRRFLYSPVRTASGLQAVVVRGDLSAADIPIGQARLLTYPESGAMLRFSLRANPTVKSSITRKREQISLDPAKDAMKLRWLDRRGRANGFEILETGVKSEPMLIDNGTKKYAINVAIYTGTLKVTDAGKFKAVLSGGIGRAETYGCGLLMFQAVDTGKDAPTG